MTPPSETLTQIKMAKPTSGGGELFEYLEVQLFSYGFQLNSPALDKNLKSAHGMALGFQNEDSSL